jgi:hypothetical protein
MANGIRGERENPPKQVLDKAAVPRNSSIAGDDRGYVAKGNSVA